MGKEATARNDDALDDDRDDNLGGGSSGEPSGGDYVVNLADLEDEPEKRGKTGGDTRGDDDPDLKARTALESIGDEDDEVRRRRREERKARREARRQRDDEKDEEIERLRKTVEEIQQGQRARETVDLKTAYSNVEREQASLARQYEEAKEMKAKAFEAQDAKGLVDADEIITQVRERYAELEGTKGAIVAQARRETAQPRVSPQLKEHAQSFMREHKWYDPAGTDRDSAHVLKIDREMAAEGWDPNTKGYWEELRFRVEDELPHKFGGGERGSGRSDDGDEDRGRPQPRSRRQITGGGGGRLGGGAGGEQVTIPAAYVANLKEAGMWDDVKVRNKMLRTYIQNEKARRASGSRR